MCFQLSNIVVHSDVLCFTEHSCLRTFGRCRKPNYHWASLLGNNFLNALFGNARKIVILRRVKKSAESRQIVNLIAKNYLKGIPKIFLKAAFIKFNQSTKFGIRHYHHFCVLKIYHVMGNKVEPIFCEMLGGRVFQYLFLSICGVDKIEHFVFVAHSFR